MRHFRNAMSGFLRRAHNGEVIILTSRDEQVAEIHPPTIVGAVARRKPGTLKGRIKMSADFDRLPEELIDAFEA